MTNDELLLLKGELTNDPLNLGLTVLPEDDEADATKRKGCRAEELGFGRVTESDVADALLRT